MSNPWIDCLTIEELEAYHILTAKLDPHFAKQQRDFYESRDDRQLSVLAHQAWLCCDGSGYRLARSYLHHVRSTPSCNRSGS